MRVPARCATRCCLLAAALLLGGCLGGGGGDGGDDGGTGGSGGSGNDAPTFAGPTSVSDTGPTLALAPDASDPDGDPLSFAWSYRGGPLDLAAGTAWTAVSAQQGDGAATLRFPTTGTYQMRVTASDPAGASTEHDVAVTVAGDAYRIAGSVTLDGAPDGGVPVAVRWQGLDAATILVATTDAGDGSYAFPDLIADRAGLDLTVGGP